MRASSTLIGRLAAGASRLRTRGIPRQGGGTIGDGDGPGFTLNFGEKTVTGENVPPTSSPTFTSTGPANGSRIVSSDSAPGGANVEGRDAIGIGPDVGMARPVPIPAKSSLSMPAPPLTSWSHKVEPDCSVSWSEMVSSFGLRRSSLPNGAEIAHDSAQSAFFHNSNSSSGNAFNVLPAWRDLPLRPLASDSNDKDDESGPSLSKSLPDGVMLSMMITGGLASRALLSNSGPEENGHFGATCEAWDGGDAADATDSDMSGRLSSVEEVSGALSQDGSARPSRRSKNKGKGKFPAWSGIFKTSKKSSSTSADTANGIPTNVGGTWFPDTEASKAIIKEQRAAGHSSSGAAWSSQADRGSSAGKGASEAVLLASAAVVAGSLASGTVAQMKSRDADVSDLTESSGKSGPLKDPAIQVPPTFRVNQSSALHSEKMKVPEIVRHMTSGWPTPAVEDDVIIGSLEQPDGREVPVPAFSAQQNVPSLAEERVRREASKGKALYRSNIDIVTVNKSCKEQDVAAERRAGVQDDANSLLVNPVSRTAGGTVVAGTDGTQGQGPGNKRPDERSDTISGSSVGPPPTADSAKPESSCGHPNALPGASKGGETGDQADDKVSAGKDAAANRESDHTADAASNTLYELTLSANCNKLVNSSDISGFKLVPIACTANAGMKRKGRMKKEKRKIPFPSTSRKLQKTMGDVPAPPPQAVAPRHQSASPPSGESAVSKGSRRSEASGESVEWTHHSVSSTSGRTQPTERFGPGTVAAATAVVIATGMEASVALCLDDDPVIHQLLSGLEDTKTITEMQVHHSNEEERYFHKSEDTGASAVSADLMGGSLNVDEESRLERYLHTSDDAGASAVSADLRAGSLNVDGESRLPDDMLSLLVKPAESPYAEEKLENYAENTEDVEACAFSAADLIAGSSYVDQGSLLPDDGLLGSPLQREESRHTEGTHFGNTHTEGTHLENTAPTEDILKMTADSGEESDSEHYEDAIDVQDEWSSTDAFSQTVMQRHEAPQVGRAIATRPFAKPFVNVTLPDSGDALASDAGYPAKQLGKVPGHAPGESMLPEGDCAAESTTTAVSDYPMIPLDNKRELVKGNVLLEAGLLTCHSVRKAVADPDVPLVKYDTQLRSGVEDERPGSSQVVVANDNSTVRGIPNTVEIVSVLSSEDQGAGHVQAVNCPVPMMDLLKAAVSVDKEAQPENGMGCTDADGSVVALVPVQTACSTALDPAEMVATPLSLSPSFLEVSFLSEADAAEAEEEEEETLAIKDCRLHPAVAASVGHDRKRTGGPIAEHEYVSEGRTSEQGMAFVEEPVSNEGQDAPSCAPAVNQLQTAIGNGADASQHLPGQEKMNLEEQESGSVVDGMNRRERPDFAAELKSSGGVPVAAELIISGARSFTLFQTGSVPVELEAHEGRDIAEEMDGEAAGLSTEVLVAGLRSSTILQTESVPVNPAEEPSHPSNVSSDALSGSDVREIVAEDSPRFTSSSYNWCKSSTAVDDDGYLPISIFSKSSQCDGTAPQEESRETSTIITDTETIITDTENGVEVGVLVSGVEGKRHTAVEVNHETASQPTDTVSESTVPLGVSSLQSKVGGPDADASDDSASHLTSANDSQPQQCSQGGGLPPALHVAADLPGSNELAKPVLSGSLEEEMNETEAWTSSAIDGNLQRQKEVPSRIGWMGKRVMSLPMLAVPAFRNDREVCTGLVVSSQQPGSSAEEGESSVSVPDLAGGGSESTVKGDDTVVPGDRDGMPEETLRETQFHIDGPASAGESLQLACQESEAPLAALSLHCQGIEQSDGRATNPGNGLLAGSAMSLPVPSKEEGVASDITSVLFGSSITETTQCSHPSRDEVIPFVQSPEQQGEDKEEGSVDVMTPVVKEVDNRAPAASTSSVQTGSDGICEEEVEMSLPVIPWSSTLTSQNGPDRSSVTTTIPSSTCHNTLQSMPVGQLVFPAAAAEKSQADRLKGVSGLKDSSQDREQAALPSGSTPSETLMMPSSSAVLVKDDVSALIVEGVANVSHVVDDVVDDRTLGENETACSPNTAVDSNCRQQGTVTLTHREFCSGPVISSQQPGPDTEARESSVTYGAAGDCSKSGSKDFDTVLKEAENREPTGTSKEEVETSLAQISRSSTLTFQDVPVPSSATTSNSSSTCHRSSGSMFADQVVFPAADAEQSQADCLKGISRPNSSSQDREQGAPPSDSTSPATLMLASSSAVSLKDDGSARMAEGVADVSRAVDDGGLGENDTPCSLNTAADCSSGRQQGTVDRTKRESCSGLVISSQQPGSSKEEGERSVAPGAASCGSKWSAKVGGPSLHARGTEQIDDREANPSDGLLAGSATSLPVPSKEEGIASDLTTVLFGSSSITETTQCIHPSENGVIPRVASREQQREDKEEGSLDVMTVVVKEAGNREAAVDTSPQTTSACISKEEVEMSLPVIPQQQTEDKEEGTLDVVTVVVKEAENWEPEVDTSPHTTSTSISKEEVEMSLPVIPQPSTLESQNVPRPSFATATIPSSTCHSTLWSTPVGQLVFPAAAAQQSQADCLRGVSGLKDSSQDQEQASLPLDSTPPEALMLASSTAVSAELDVSAQMAEAVPVRNMSDVVDNGALAENNTVCSSNTAAAHGNSRQLGMVDLTEPTAGFYEVEKCSKTVDDVKERGRVKIGGLSAVLQTSEGTESTGLADGQLSVTLTENDTACSSITAVLCNSGQQGMIALTGSPAGFCEAEKCSITVYDAKGGGRVTGGPSAIPQASEGTKSTGSADDQLPVMEDGVDEPAAGTPIPVLVDASSMGSCDNEDPNSSDGVFVGSFGWPLRDGPVAKVKAVIQCVRCRIQACEETSCMAAPTSNVTGSDAGGSAEQSAENNSQSVHVLLEPRAEQLPPVSGEKNAAVATEDDRTSAPAVPPGVGTSATDSIVSDDDQCTIYVDATEGERAEICTPSGFNAGRSAEGDDAENENSLPVNLLDPQGEQSPLMSRGENSAVSVVDGTSIPNVVGSSVLGGVETTETGRVVGEDDHNAMYVDAEAEEEGPEIYTEAAEQFFSSPSPGDLSSITPLDSCASSPPWICDSFKDAAQVLSTPHRSGTESRTNNSSTIGSPEWYDAYTDASATAASASPANWVTPEGTSIHQSSLSLSLSLPGQSNVATPERARSRRSRSRSDDHDGSAHGRLLAQEVQAVDLAEKASAPADLTKPCSSPLGRDVDAVSGGFGGGRDVCDTLQRTQRVTVSKERELSVSTDADARILHEDAHAPGTGVGSHAPLATSSLMPLTLALNSAEKSPFVQSRNCNDNDPRIKSVPCPVAVAISSPDWQAVPGTPLVLDSAEMFSLDLMMSGDEKEDKVLDSVAHPIPRLIVAASVHVAAVKKENGRVLAAAAPVLIKAASAAEADQHKRPARGVGGAHEGEYEGGGIDILGLGTERLDGGLASEAVAYAAERRGAAAKNSRDERKGVPMKAHKSEDKVERSPPSKTESKKDDAAKNRPISRESTPPDNGVESDCSISGDTPKSWVIWRQKSGEKRPFLQLRSAIQSLKPSANSQSDSPVHSVSKSGFASSRAIPVLHPDSFKAAPKNRVSHHLSFRERLMCCVAPKVSA
ncbi:hypothetical protein CBR_g2813 [Chara braunii]|uniref:Uncharacterized protein n=1 Tax=Chara braunii TaxID=69332 RepID=A0A388KDX9_CHABU|nr:hypothetical protein CBR_g2813 [Chara braunii]|eukprot:GBG68264.1 hypothetical protein CBR_g2813 [Chara braunii]